MTPATDRGCSPETGETFLWVSRTSCGPLRGLSRGLRGPSRGSGHATQARLTISLSRPGIPGARAGGLYLPDESRLGPSQFPAASRKAAETPKGLTRLSRDKTRARKATPPACQAPPPARRQDQSRRCAPSHLSSRESFVFFFFLHLVSDQRATSGASGPSGLMLFCQSQGSKQAASFPLPSSRSRESHRAGPSCACADLFGAEGRSWRKCLSASRDRSAVTTFSKLLSAACRDTPPPRCLGL